MSKIIIGENDIGKRFDIAVTEKENCEISRSQFKKLVQFLAVFIDGVPLLDCSKKVLKVCIITIDTEKILNNSSTPPIAEQISLNILYEDDDIIVIDKESGMVCHPAPGHYSGTLVNALLWHCTKKNLSNHLGDMFRPGIVHRLDKDTSGLMIVAKNNLAHIQLAKYFAKEKGKNIIRKYKCIVFGSPISKESIIETFIQRDRKNRQKYVNSNLYGKKAITKYKLLKSVYITSNKPVSIIECELFTGRTHQIRVHMKHISCPIIGDPIYGKSKIEIVYPDKIRAFHRTALHSHYLEFTHPISSKRMFFESQLPKDMLELSDNLFDI